MKVHLIRRETVDAYKKQNAQSRVSFEVWLVKLKYADWELPEDIQSSFSSVDLLGKGSNRVVFDIGGNKYRLIAKYAFGDVQVHLFICWIGTHAEYDKLCKTGEQYRISNY
jgi:mRNA interferase HigB